MRRSALDTVSSTELGTALYLHVREGAADSVIREASAEPAIGAISARLIVGVQNARSHRAQNTPPATEKGAPSLSVPDGDSHSAGRGTP